MSLPAPLADALQARFGPIGACRPVPGGSVNRAYRVETARKRVMFLKYNETAPTGMFRAEAAGLRALAEAAGEHLRTPQVFGHAEHEGRVPGWIALEWLEPNGRHPSSDEALGRGLAALHRIRQPSWGWRESNFIGTLHQANTPRRSWGEFWRDHRLAPLLRRAVDSGQHPGRPTEWERLFMFLPDMLETGDDEGPSLLHGDLWSGNVVPTEQGPAVLDPAVYCGHREVDLAMSELFGGFGGRFMAAYQEAFPLRTGYAKVRRPIYQLYYLLVHVNLFGPPYAEQAATLLRQCLGT